ncbi:SARP family transcriptional regulator [Winogradskya consettensis]|uniref:SARP family transcriptional regulator n=1 Tax=Winogradskya consettensis TaxID=113560 RepID=A0A919ST11_9ACTN|nr:SARP family transcriptional regulator [Actinoplanes consettensis]
MLGPVEARGPESAIAFGGERARSLLACLLLNAGRVVSVEQLIDAVWDDQPPAGARIQVQNRVSTLRNRLREGGLGDEVILRRSPGYLLRLDAIPFDLAAFDAGVARAEELGAAGRIADASAELAAALELWHGPALSGLDTAYLRAAAQNLEERHLRALETRFGWELDLGRPTEVVDELTVLVDQHPFRERFVELLMLALTGAGRRSEAVDAYQNLRKRLAAELGLDPGVAVQRVFRAVLNGPVTVSGNRRPAPAQLPADLPFAGRTRQLDELDALLGARSCVVITGTAGVGKSALAVHWARRVASRFPDGQLYVGLRGFSTRGQPLPAEEALLGFLDALEVPPEDIPATHQARIGLYRSLLAGRRMLILLDDAHDADQVRDLLPGAPGSLAVVTSRDPLAGLVVSEGAAQLALRLLDPAEARVLLAQRIGADRLDEEPSAVSALIEECSRLPLALAVAAARAASSTSLASYVDRLRAARGTLDAFTMSDRATDVRGVFALSYRTLSPDAARLFRLLHLRIGGAISTAAVAALHAGQLDELVDAQLVSRVGDEHYTTHDLLHAYAGELAREIDTEPDRTAAWHRLLDHYLHSAAAADRMIYPARPPIELGTPADASRPEQFATDTAAMAWFATEYQAAIEAVRLAAETGEHRRSSDLAWTLSTYLSRSGHWNEWYAVHRTGLAAAQQAGDLPAQARSLRDMANACVRLRRYDDARESLLPALAIYEQLGDLDAQGRCFGQLAWIEEREGRYDVALELAQRKLELVTRAGLTGQLAGAYNNLGWAQALAGDFEAAIANCVRGVELFAAQDDKFGETYARDSLAYALQHSGRHAAAIAEHRRVHEMSVELGDRYQQGTTLHRLGDTYAAAGQTDAARDSWRQALTILDEVDLKDASVVREKLK